MSMTKRDSTAHKFIPVVLAAIIALASLILTVFLIVDSGYRSKPDSNTEDSVSVVIVNNSQDHSGDQQVRWLKYSLEKAELPVMEAEIEPDMGTNSFSSLISRWHNWKQERGLAQGRVWLIIVGVEPDLAVELSLAWENSDLVLLPDFNDLKYFSSWQDFASSLSLRWTEDRSILIYHIGSDKEKAAAIYERISNEDAWLFPGQPVYPGSSVKMIRSSDGSSKIGLLETGILDQYSWSASYLDSIVSELAVGSVATEQNGDIASRVDKTSDSLRLQWFLLPLSIILLILISLVSGISVYAAASQRFNRVENNQSGTSDEMIDESVSLPVMAAEPALVSEIPDRQNILISLFLRIAILIAFISSVAAVLNAVQLLPLLTASWWMTALVLVLIMIILIPDARLGIAEQKLEKASAVRVLSGLIWLLLGLGAAFIVIKAFILDSVPYDSLIWLITGLLLIVSARIAVRRSSALGCRVWLTLPAGAWLMLNGISIISHFTGFN